MIALLKYAPWIAVGLAVIAAGVFYAFMRGAQGQRDAARAQTAQVRAEKDQEVLARVVAEGNAKVAADAADRLGREVRDQTGRCDQSIAELRTRAEGYRSALRKCPSGEALAERLGAVFP